MQQLRTALNTAGLLLIGAISVLNTFPADASGLEPGPTISITGGDTESRSIVDKAIAQDIDSASSCLSSTSTSTWAVVIATRRPEGSGPGGAPEPAPYHTP